MGYDLTLSGLLRKRNELASDAAALKDRLGARLSDLDALDRVIRIFKPDIDLSDLPERPAPLALTGTRGEFQRFLIDQLRQADRPLTTFDLTEIIMRERGLDAKDRVTFKLLSHRAGHSLAKLRRKGTVQSRRVGSGALLEWQIAQA